MNQYSKLQEAHNLVLQKLNKKFKFLRLLHFVLVVCIVFVFISCEETSVNNQVSQGLKESSKKSIKIFKFKEVLDSHSIMNNTDLRIEVLFNNIKGFLAGSKNGHVYFRTECMSCQPFQVYRDGFIFGKKLYFTKEVGSVYSDEPKIPDSLNYIKTLSLYDKDNSTFNFSNGTITFENKGQSCNDADFINIEIQYETGLIKINRLINAGFFEFDIDENGIQEQYVFGRRNCSQEFALIRISS